MSMDRNAVEAFLIEEAHLIDEKRWRDWQKLFSTDALYWIPSNRIDADPLQHVSFVYDDMELLNERLIRLESEFCFAQAVPSSTLHQISNIAIAPGEQDGEIAVRSNQVIYEFKNNSQRRLEPLNIFPAFCEHILRRADTGVWQIRYKKVGLLNCDAEITNLTFLL